MGKCWCCPSKAGSFKWLFKDELSQPRFVSNVVKSNQPFVMSQRGEKQGSVGCRFIQWFWSVCLNHNIFRNICSIVKKLFSVTDGGFSYSPRFDLVFVAFLHLQTAVPPSISFFIFTKVLSRAEGTFIVTVATDSKKNIKKTKHNKNKQSEGKKKYSSSSASLRRHSTISPANGVVFVFDSFFASVCFCSACLCSSAPVRREKKPQNIFRFAWRPSWETLTVVHRLKS